MRPLSLLNNKDRFSACMLGYCKLMTVMGNAIKKDVIHAEGIDIGIYTSDYENEFISLTDIAKKKEGEYPGYVIQNWMRNRSVISFIGLWEALHNPNFNCLEFEAIKNEAGDNGFVMTPKRWIE